MGGDSQARCWLPACLWEMLIPQQGLLKQGNLLPCWSAAVGWLTCCCREAPPSAKVLRGLLLTSVQRVFLIAGGPGLDVHPLTPGYTVVEVGDAILTTHQLLLCWAALARAGLSLGGT
jgi:hypothetical protein